MLGSGRAAQSGTNSAQALLGALIKDTRRRMYFSDPWFDRAGAGTTPASHNLRVNSRWAAVTPGAHSGQED